MERDPYRYFRVEARELVDQLGKGILDLERGGPEPDAVSRLLRLAHTLKGAARVVKQKEIADLAHSIEDGLARLRQHPGTPPREHIDATLKLVDAINERVTALAAPPAPERERHEAAYSSAVAAPELGTEPEEIDALLDGISEAHGHVTNLQRGLEGLARIRSLSALLAEQLRPQRTVRPSDEARGPAAAAADELHGAVGGLARRMESSVQQIEREIRQVRHAAERMKLLPARVLFTPLERAARDAANALGRRVRFESRGGDVRLDGSVLAVLQGALLQLVRNAVAHGIESESERSAAGKAPEGTITLEVARRGSRVSFACRDDGRGVDLDAVRRVAVQRGLLRGDAPALRAEEVLRALLAGGISTSGAVTELSGRGIGLDVVRDAAARLGGEAAVRTVARAGTVVELIVPAALSTREALLVAAAEHVAAIPLECVRRAVRLETNEVVRTADALSILFEGALIPFAPLERVLAVGSGGPPARRTRSAVVVAGSGSLAALGVDRLLGVETLVLRPPPPSTPGGTVVFATSTTAAGDPQIVLDPDSLVSAATRAGAGDPDGVPVRSPILVVDDSLTTRMLEQSILESAGYAVDLAASGEEGLEKARQRRYALFLVDVEMPGMDGFTFVERVRADPDLRDIPAILVTSRTSEEDRRRGRTAGARGYIVKSEFDQADLLAKIRELAG